MLLQWPIGARCVPFSSSRPCDDRAKGARKGCGRMKSKPKTKAPDARDIEVGRRIRAQRLVRGMSQTQLGKKLGITFQQIQKYEKGANRVGAGRLTRIADVLGVPVSFFFGGTEHGAT